MHFLHLVLKTVVGIKNRLVDGEEVTTGGEPAPEEGSYFVCGYCTFATSRKAAFSNHLQTHAGVQSPYKLVKPINRRRRPTNATKLHVLEQLQKYHELHGDNFPRSYFIKHIGYSKSSISLWLQSPRLAMAVHSELSKMNYLNAFFTVAEPKGKKWLRDQMETIMHRRKPENYKNFKYSNGWIAKFLDYYDVSSQVQTEKKPVSNSLRVPLLQTFHRELCLIQQGVGLNARDAIYGRFSPECMWNVDQIPASFISDRRNRSTRVEKLVGSSTKVIQASPNE